MHVRRSHIWFHILLHVLLQMQNVARILSGTGTESKLTALKRMQQCVFLLTNALFLVINIIHIAYCTSTDTCTVRIQEFTHYGH